MLSPKQLKSMSPSELKLAMAKREAVITQYRRETHQLKREIDKRSPRAVHFRIEMDDVVSESEDSETSPESLASGRYTRAQFIKWWRLLEEDD